MKTRFTLLYLLLASTLISQAQSVRISIMGGYCAPVATDMMETSSQQILVPGYSGLSGTTGAMLSRQSYGQSGCVGMGIQWFSKKDIGFGLRMTAFISSPTSGIENVTDQYGNITTYYNSYHAFSFQFVPHIALKHDFRVVSPIAELGMILGANSVKADYSSDVYSTTINQHGGVMLGFYSSLGLAFHISRAVDFMLAVHCNAASYSPTEWTRKSYIYMGQNVIGQIPQSAMSGTYTNNYQAGGVQDPKFTLPFSNVGFTTGFAFRIGRKAGSNNLHKDPKKFKEPEPSFY